MNIEGKGREKIDDLGITESTPQEDGRKKPSFAEKTRFQDEIGDLSIEDFIAAYDLKTEKHHP